MENLTLRDSSEEEKQEETVRKPKGGRKKKEQREVRDPAEVRKELWNAQESVDVDASGDGGVIIRTTTKPKDQSAPHGGAENPFVEVHYEGFLLENGEKFDSSRESGYPMVVQLGKGSVIAGWEVALQALLVGEIADVIIRSDYAYGEEGDEDIPAGATLKFVIEVLDARKTPKAIAPVSQGNDADAERLEAIRKQREEAARRREEDRKAAEEKRAKAAEAAAARLANKGQKGGKGKGKKK